MENGTSATRVVLYIVLASAISALATVGLCVGVLYGAYGALLSPTGAAKLSAIVSNMNVTDGAITGLLIGDMDTPHNLLLGAGTDETNFTGAWIKFGTEEYPGLLFEDAGNATSLLPVMHITSHMTTNKEHMLPDSLDGDSSIGRTLESGNCANPHLHAGGFIPPPCFAGVCIQTVRFVEQSISLSSPMASDNLGHHGRLFGDATRNTPPVPPKVRRDAPGRLPVQMAIAVCGCVPGDQRGWYVGPRHPATARIVPGEVAPGYISIYVHPKDGLFSTALIAAAGDTIGVESFVPPFSDRLHAGQCWCKSNPP